MGNWSDFTPSNGVMSPYLKLVGAHLVYIRVFFFQLAMLVHLQVISGVRKLSGINSISRILMVRKQTRSKTLKCYTPENQHVNGKFQPLEDASHMKKGDFPAHVSFQGRCHFTSINS